MKIALIGFASSGKDTCGKYLVKTHGYQDFSFASPLKDALSAIFGWDRELLEGETEESRIWRETIDEWWAKKLGIPDFTPRKAMQMVGTDTMRKHFDNGIWIHSMERRLSMVHGDNIIIKDCRFPNEINLARKQGYLVVRVRRGPEPIWYDDALRINLYEDGEDIHNIIPVHSSEWRWIGQKMDLIIDNEGSLDDLYSRILSLIWDSPNRGII